MNDPNRALMLIGHGTRSARGVAQFEALAEAVARERPATPVGSGFIELVAPDLHAGMDNLVERGATSIVGIPVVLLGAGHLKDDGPAALSSARHRHPGLTTAYAREMGAHPLVLSVAADRIRAVSDTPADAVVLVGRGSSDPDANADLAKVARLLADSRGIGVGMDSATAVRPDGERGTNLLGLVEPAFVSLAAPDVPTALDRVHRLGARQISVVPYFLFHGILVDRIRAQAEAWAVAHPEVTVLFGEELGPDHRLVELIWARFDEASGGQAAMNCDGCIYRAALPGYEDRVGAPPFG